MHRLASSAGAEPSIEVRGKEKIVKTEQALQLANYLEQNAASYSHGIPLRSLREALDALPAESISTSESSVVVLTSDEKVSQYEGEAGALLQAAIEKGLKLPLERVSCFYPGANLVAKLKEKLTGDTPVLLVGDGAKSWFSNNFTDCSDPTFEIVDPQDVIKDPSLKRTLWNQLKPIIELL